MTAVVLEGERRLSYKTEGRTAPSVTISCQVEPHPCPYPQPSNDARPNYPFSVRMEDFRNKSTMNFFYRIQSYDVRP